MKRRFLFCIADSWGPLGCTIPVARELERRGHDVQFVVFDFHGFINRTNEIIPALDAAAILRSEGLGVIDAQVSAPPVAGRVPTPKNFLLEYRAFRSLFRDYFMPYYEQWLTAMLPKFRAFRPDVMWVKDQVLAGAMAAQILDVPWASFSVHTGFLESGDSLPWTMGLSAPRGAIERTRNQVLKWVMRRFRMTLDGVVNDTRVRLGLPRMEDALFGTPVSPHLYLLFVPRELEPPRDSWPPQVRFVGPYCWDEPRRYERPQWLASLPKNEPLVYSTIGTLSNRMEMDFYETLMKALGDQPYTVAVSAGGYEDHYVVSRLPKAPANFRVEAFLPNSVLVPRARAVVHHAGAGTTMHGLMAGVPAVAVPLNHEHHDFAQRLVEHGCGIRIDKSKATPTRIREGVATLLRDDAYARAAQRMKRTLGHYDAVGTCADELQALAERARRVSVASPPIQAAMQVGAQ
jgi:MGT family glycosyltransferase